MATEVHGATTDQRKLTSAEIKAQWKKEDATTVKSEIVWPKLIFMALMHAGAIYGFTLMPGASWKTNVGFLVLWYMSGFGITAGVHRLWAHKSYEAHISVRIFLMLFNSMAYQGSIMEWARDHRTHHKCSETDGDPHDARQGFFFAHMGWVWTRKHPEVIRQGRKLDLTDLEADGVVQFQKRHYAKLAVLMCFVVPAMLGWMWGDTLKAFWIMGFARYVWVLHMTWFVNSAAHLWGHRPYSPRINPAENYFVALGAIGEGWHNYHHAFPYDYSASEWSLTQISSWRFNPTTVFIDICAALGLVWNRRKVPQEIVAKRLAAYEAGTEVAEDEKSY
jgi:stearoyl-CoA desaturase (delta-9 desaturase)